MIVYNQQSYSQELGTGQGISIALYGCALCSLASLLSAFGISVDPLTLNNILIQNKAYADNGSGQYDLIIWTTISSIYNQLSLAFNNRYPSAPADMSLIDNQLSKGCPVIVGVDINHNPNATDPSHFVCIYKKNEDGSYQCVDSWYNDDTSFDARYAVNGMSVAQCILQAISFNGTADPLVCDPKSVRDTFIGKASNYDEFVKAGYNSVQDVITKINGLQGQINSLNQKVGELQTDNGNLTVAISQAKGTNAALATEIQKIESSDSTAIDNGRKAEKALSDLQIDFVSIAKALNAKSDLPSILSAISTMQAKKTPRKVLYVGLWEWLKGLI